MPLSEGMRKTIIGIGYTAPTPIQAQSIPELLLGCDLLGQAQTGTGKTAAFSIPLVELVNEHEDHVQALVVCPTRELCLQVCQEIKRLSVHKQGLGVVALYGGQSIEQQFKSLKSDRPQIVVATPGRLFDHLRRKSVALSQVRMIVLDEADEMLDMGFRPEIEQIFDLLPEENQRIFFSATMAKAIKDLACSYLRNPKIIKTESKTLTVSTIEQSYFRVRGREKTELLCRVLDYKNPKLAVVFCNAKSTADEIVDEIKSYGFETGVLHGDLSQNQRDRVMAQFKSGLVRVLVATDVAARGLDIDDVELVCNYHLPHDPEDYVHRIGRTGRAGRAGCAISLVEPRDNSRLRKISLYAKIEIAEAQPPTLAQVKAAKLAILFGQVKEALTSKKINEYRSALSMQQLSSEDVAAGMLQLALKKFDEQSKTDAAFLDLSTKKYSGYDSEKRFKSRPEREGGRNERRGYSENRRPSFNDEASRDRGPRKRPFAAGRDQGSESRFSPRESNGERRESGYRERPFAGRDRGPESRLSARESNGDRRMESGGRRERPFRGADARPRTFEQRPSDTSRNGERSAQRNFGEEKREKGAFKRDGKPFEKKGRSPVKRGGKFNNSGR